MQRHIGQGWWRCLRTPLRTQYHLALALSLCYINEPLHIGPQVGGSSCHGPLALSDPQTLHCAAEGLSLGRMRPFSSPRLLWESPCPPPLLGSDPSSLWASGQPHVVETFHLVQPCPSTTQLSVSCVTLPGGHILFLNQLPATLRVWLLSSSLCRIASFWRVNKKGMCRLTWSPFCQENKFSYTCQWKVSRLTYSSLSKMAKESGEVSI